MGVDGPGGRAAFGRGGVAAAYRTDRVDLASARPPDEVVAAIEARTSYGSLLWSWYRGSGVARRGGPPGELKLAVRHDFSSFQHVASVRVEPAPGGSRVRGAIGLPREYRLGMALATICTLVWVALPLAGGRGGAGWLILNAVFLVYLGVGPRLSYGDRAVLRGLLADAAGVPRSLSQGRDTTA